MFEQRCKHRPSTNDMMLFTRRYRCFQNIDVSSVLPINNCRVNCQGAMTAARASVLILPRCGLEFCTPALLLHTKGGSVPHITREVFNMITEDRLPYQIPLLTTHQMKSGVQAQGEGIAKFVGLADNPTYLTFHDPSTAIPISSVERETIPLWTRMGKMLFSADEYMDVVDVFKPDMYDVLNDGVTDKTTSRKRSIKSVERSIQLFTKCVERHTSSENLKNSLLFAPIGGGFHLEERQKLLDHILLSAKDIDGFVLDGLVLDDCEMISYENISYMVEPVTKQLPPEKLRMAKGAWNALTTIDLICAGWDLFDTSMPYLVTERNSALIFAFKENAIVDIVPNKDHYEMKLFNEMFKEDFRPISSDCNCLTCTKHTRAYINHLLVANEMLAGVLLMIHNLHHYLEFFKEIRKCISSNTIKALRDKIAVQQATQKSLTRNIPGPMLNKRPRVM